MVQLNVIGRDAMLAAQAHAATDITGFGLAGHAYEMAKGSGVTLRFELEKLPALPGVESLIERKFFTRASKSNREYVTAALRFEREPDPVRVELMFDAQTSGGLLIAVPPHSVERIVEQLRQAGAAAAAVVGEVSAREARVGRELIPE